MLQESGSFVLDGAAAMLLKFTANCSASMMFPKVNEVFPFLPVDNTSGSTVDSVDGVWRRALIPWKGSVNSFSGGTSRGRKTESHARVRLEILREKRNKRGGNWQKNALVWESVCEAESFRPWKTLVRLRVASNYFPLKSASVLEEGDQ